MTTISRRYEIDMGHALAEHGGKCYRPHGHRYVIEATVEGPVLGEGVEQGMVIDFARLRDTLDDIVGSYDHRFVMAEDDPRRPGMVGLFGAEGVATITCAPTAENLARLWGECLNAALPVDLVSLVVWETPNCRAEWEPFLVLPEPTE